MSDIASKISRRSLLLSSPLLFSGFQLLNTFGWASFDKSEYTVWPISFTDVDISNGFWAPRMEVNREVSIWHCFERMKKVENFGSSKLIEGAAYMIAKRPDPKLEQYVDQLIDKQVAGVQSRLTDPDR